jgi:glycosyltransferase involved in cell wall biosynthesis
MKDILTVIIPCKNEEKYIGNCLFSLSKQVGIDGVRVVISDAGSTDNTIKIIESYKNILNIEVIPGGLPAVGRNNGAKVSNTEYLLFIDADAEIYDVSMILKSMEKISEGSHLLASKLNSHYFIVKFLYKLNNILIWLSKYDKPFCVGIYFLIRRDIFISLGGFPEDVMHCEDYLLSKIVDRKKFTIINKDVYSDNRRFKKMGYFKMILYILKNTINRNNYNYFKKDISYWK